MRSPPLLHSAFVALTLAATALAGCSAQTEDDVADQSQNAVGENAVARSYEGSLGTLPIMMRLESTGGSLRGSYFYVGGTTTGEPLVLAGSSGAGKVTLDEKFRGAKTGSFSGTIERGGKLEGTWKSPNGRTTLPFTLEAVTAPIPVLRRIEDHAERSAPTEDDRKCDLEVSFIEMFGLADATAEKKVNEALAKWAVPLVKNHAGKCTEDNSASVWSGSTPKLLGKDVVVVEIGSETMGGAYPSRSIEWFNVGTKTGRVFTLKDAIKPESMAQLEDKVIAAIRASDRTPDDRDFLVEKVQSSFDRPESVQFEVREAGINISFFNALPHAAQAIDGDGTLIEWADLRGMTSENGELAAFTR